MPQDLQIAIGGAVAALGALTQKVASNTEAGVEAAVMPPAEFFNVVQSRAALLGNDVAAAKNRLGVGRRQTWTDQLLIQAITDLQSARNTMGLTADQQSLIDVAIASLQQSQAAVQTLWNTLAAQGVT